MSDLSTLKEEILEWANKPGTMKKFTTHDVYDAIHSAEDISKTSDTLRGMWRHDKTLDREEFMDGNRKRFFYWLRNAKVDNKQKLVDKEIPYVSAYGVNVTQHTHQKEDNVSINQQIEIPNNFCIELKTPNGFTITIKAGDLMK